MGAVDRLHGPVAWHLDMDTAAKVAILVIQLALWVRLADLVAAVARLH